MKYQITFEIEAGEKTCASEKGKFCANLRQTMSGKCYCDLFGPCLAEDNGWIQRCPQCLEVAKVINDEDSGYTTT